MVDKWKVPIFWSEQLKMKSLARTYQIKEVFKDGGRPIGVWKLIKITGSLVCILRVWCIASAY